MKQASVLDGLSFYFLALQENCPSPAEVYVRWREVLEALVISPMVMIGDEGINLVFEIVWKEVVFQEDAVLQGLMPALDLSLCLWTNANISFLDQRCRKLLLHHHPKAHPPRRV